VKCKRELESARAAVDLRVVAAGFQNKNTALRALCRVRNLYRALYRVRNLYRALYRVKNLYRLAAMDSH
jgi:hypothetical protein